MKFKCTFEKEYKVIHFLPDAILVLKDKTFIKIPFLQIGWLCWIIRIEL